MIKQLVIKENITDHLIFVLDQLKINNIGIELNSSCTINGFQTNNINEVPCMQDTLNDILEYLPIKNLKHRWFHLIDYDKMDIKKNMTIKKLKILAIFYI
jgi:hypothetical protein